MTEAFFRDQMSRMNGLRFAPADLQTHWEGLHDLPADVLELAIGRAIKFRIEFPTPVELRQDADQAAPRRPERDEEPPALPEPKVLGTLPTGKVVTATHEWKYYCERCGDTGWREYWCGPQPVRKPWMERRSCDTRCSRLLPDYSHEWADRCACIDTNPAIRKRREREAKYAAERTKS